jgi:hypothetical protein
MRGEVCVHLYLWYLYVPVICNVMCTHTCNTKLYSESYLY